ncbi:hypothetical protein KR054_000791 [Drosophila jambulina]|nr:hypothetical protein KR054_000791 [Drosophila jambulina]
MVATLSVGDLVKLYENLIAAASNDALDKPRRILEEQAAKVRSLSEVSMHNLDVDDSATGEPHRGVLKAIDSPMSDCDVADIVEEFANTTVQPEPQLVENPQRLHRIDSDCFKLVFRKVTYLFRLHKQPKNHPARKQAEIVPELHETVLENVDICALS